MHRFRRSWLFVLPLLPWLLLDAWPLPDHVTDGDSLRLGRERIRLAGIDAPELDQWCLWRDVLPYPCGKVSALHLSRLSPRLPDCEGEKRDRYGRRLAECRSGDGLSINAAQVASGWAVAYRQYNGQFIPQELEAQASGRGVWSGAFELPCGYRGSC